MYMDRLKSNIRNALGLESVTENEDEDLDLDIEDEDDAEDTDDSEEVNLDIGDDEEIEDEEPQDLEDDDPEEVGDVAPAPVQNDEDKIKEMFSDSGDVYNDYSLSNENNIRLSKFRFTYAGLDLDDLMTNEERDIGVSADQLYARLSPEQQDRSLRMWKKLRNKFPDIADRERMILIHNANIMLFRNDEDGRQIELPDNLRKNAYAKIDALMKKRYGETWQDEKEAIDFLTSIKINFDDENSVKPSLLSLESFTDLNQAGKISFNKVFAEAPASVNTFLRTNKDNSYFNKSPIFQSLISDYREEDTSVGTLSPILKGTPVEEPTDEGEEVEDDETGEGGDFDLGGGDDEVGDLDLGGGDEEPMDLEDDPETDEDMDDEEL